MKYFIINTVGPKNKKETSKIPAREKFKLLKYLIPRSKPVCALVKYKTAKMAISTSCVSKVL
ncbi:Uncharacterised protein [Streptococcus pneumoniae]|nr:Uncharacterised protein [Streptococcus pneumoniae]